MLLRVLRFYAIFTVAREGDSLEEEGDTEGMMEGVRRHGGSEGDMEGMMEGHGGHDGGSEGDMEGAKEE